MMISTALLLATATSAFATERPQSDPAEAHANAVKTRSVNYSCQNGKSVTVKYGFNNQNLPTYAEASVNGKVRFMPINLNLTDSVGTVFGDEDNFSLSGGVDANAITYRNVRSSSINIQSPSSEIVYKGCRAVRR